MQATVDAENIIKKSLLVYEEDRNREKTIICTSGPVSAESSQNALWWEASWCAQLAHGPPKYTMCSQFSELLTRPKFSILH
jgi:hypothetical protein